MSDVRALLKTERTARRIQHKHAGYSSTGTLLCTACHLQLKSATLWDGHLRSAGHIMRAQKLEQQQVEEETDVSEEPVNEINTKKRKASDSEDTIRKRSRAENGVPGGFFDPGQDKLAARTVLPSPTTEIQIPSRPATPSKPPQDITPRREADESEWAAFEADIAAAEEPVLDDNAVISAPAMTAAELVDKSLEESNTQKRERREAELEGDKEDAARKMEEELEEMESLEQRVKRLREKREELRRKESLVGFHQPQPQVTTTSEGLNGEEEDDDDDDDDDDEWDAFRMR